MHKPNARAPIHPPFPRPPRLALALCALAGLAGCTDGVNPASPAFWPFNILTTASTDPAEQQRRGAVELAVKSGFPAILNEINAGSGPNLQAALDAARVPQQDRSARILQLQGDLPLYSDNPGALVTSLLIYGSAAG
jgi:hypothetical protein